MLRNERQAVVEMRRMSYATLRFRTVDLGRNLEHRRVDEVNRLRMELANDGSVPLPMRKPVIPTELDLLVRLRRARTTRKVVRLVKRLRRRVPNAVLRPDARPELPSRVTLPSPGRLAIRLEGGRQPGDGSFRVDLDRAISRRSESTRPPVLDGELLAHSETESLKGGGHGTDAENAVLAVSAEVGDSKVTSIGFVDRVPADDTVIEQVSGVGDGLSELAHGAEEVVLEVVLNVAAVDDALRSEVATGEEHGEDGLAGETGVVGRPDHGRKVGGVGRRWVRPFALENGGAGTGEVFRLETAGEERPVRSAGTAGEARPLWRVRW